MYLAEPDDEIEGIVGYVGQQLDAIRASVIGLTDEQARLCPCRSSLSIGGLIKHATYGMRSVTERLSADSQPRAPIDEAGLADYNASFKLGDDETAAAALAAFDAARVEYVAAISATDPSTPTIEGPAPWFGVFDDRPRVPATCWSTRSRKWRGTPDMPTSSASRSTPSPSQRSC